MYFHSRHHPVSAIFISVKRIVQSRIIVVIGVVLLVLITAVGLIVASGVRTVIADIIKADAAWLLLIIGAQSFAYWSYVVPYKYVFNISYRDALKHSFEGFHPFRPGGGFVYDFKCHKSVRGRARVIYLGLWEYAALAPAILIAAIYAYFYKLIPSQVSLPWIIGVPAGAILFLLLLSFRSHIHNHPKTKKTLNVIHQMLVKENLRHTLILLSGMAFYWIGEVFSLYGALKLFDINLGWIALLIAYASGYLITRRSLPLGGAGVILLTLSLALHVVGLALPVAVLSAMTYQIANLIVPMVYRRLLPLNSALSFNR